jgi:F-type H+-transporting ATPase subunit c
MAQGVPAASSNQNDTNSWLGAAAAFAIAIAALGGTTGQGRATAAALEGIARQPSAAPRIQTPMILGLALIESLVLFAFVVAYMLLGKIKV